METEVKNRSTSAKIDPPVVHGGFSPIRENRNQADHSILFGLSTLPERAMAQLKMLATGRNRIRTALLCHPFRDDPSCHRCPNA